jgi:enoyl-[acyl-carrier protein] reductase II
MKNRITELLGIDLPIIQAGMIWCSGWRLAAAVSKKGGLGIIGSGSMYPEVLKEHIQKLKVATDKPFAVNVPLIYPNIEDHISIIIEEKVPIVFSSAGNPRQWTPMLKENGIKVVHVVSSKKFALKAEAAGVDAVVAEGFEAGGHNGREETTTLVLIPEVADALSIPVIAAGGIGSGRAMAAVFALGAEGVQIGSRFVCSAESSAHAAFKQKVVETSEGETILTLKELTPVRLIKNPFYKSIAEACERDAGLDELKALLGRGRAKKGMFEGDLEEGELEIGQVSSHIKSIHTAAEIVDEIFNEFKQTLEKLRTEV